MTDDTDELFDYEAAAEVGGKILEMCDRLDPVEKITPGARATWVFFVDDVNYKVTLEVHSRGEPFVSDAPA